MLIWVSAVMGTTVETDGLRLAPPPSAGPWGSGEEQQFIPALPSTSLLLRPGMRCCRARVQHKAGNPAQATRISRYLRGQRQL